MNGFVRTRFEMGETAVTVAADDEYIGRATDAIVRTRRDIVRQISDDPFFLTTFEPYDCPRTASETVQMMCEAAASAGVGPMATVAGTVAQRALEAMMEEGCTHCWVDNGGDIALMLDRPVTVEVFCDPASSEAFGLELTPSGGPLGVCASSGRLGHSVSLGDADIAVAQCDSAILADALATAIGNAVSTEDDLGRCFGRFRGLRGFQGALVLRDGGAGMYGSMERVVPVEHNPERVTVHSIMRPRGCVGPGRAETTEART
jgi:ApbE superfamily uncharacterized protein (UPF0280 family)